MLLFLLPLAYCQIHHLIQEKLSLNEVREFCFDEAELKPNTKYALKVQYLGSLGIDIALFWKSEELHNFINSYQPLDTNTLLFKIQEKANIRRCAYLAPYKVSISIEDPGVIEYILFIEELVVDGVSSRELMHYGLVVFGSLALTIGIWVWEKTKKTKRE